MSGIERTFERVEVAFLASRNLGASPQTLEKKAKTALQDAKGSQERGNPDWARTLRADAVIFLNTARLVVNDSRKS